MALPSTSDLLNAAYSAYYDGTGLPSTLRLLRVDGKPLTLRNDETGFFGAAFVAKSGQVIIAYEGTDLSSFEDNPEFAVAQVLADYQIYLGQTPPAYADALQFARTAIAAAKAQGYDADDIFLSGHSLGAAEVQFVAARLNLPGETYGGPGIPLSSIPAGRVSQLVNYVEYGDPVGNYNTDPNPLGDFLYSNQIVRFGSASYLGDPLDAVQLVAAGYFFGPDSTEAGRAIGYALLADAAYDHHLLKYYAKDLNVTLPNQNSGVDALTKAETLEILTSILNDGIPVSGGLADDTLLGTARRDAVRGGAGDDILYGRNGHDRIYGNAGSDTLIGGFGHDRLMGGTGYDVLKGSAGSDTFVFETNFDTTVARKGRDTVLDFSHTERDRIDLQLIDASTKKGGNQTFRFIDDQAFGQNAGELQARVTRGGDTLVSGDLDGDGSADFAITLHGRVNLSAGDFLL